MAKEQIETKGAWHIAIIKDVEETVRRYWHDLGIGPWQLVTFGGPKIRAKVYGTPVQLVVKAAITQVGSLTIGIDQALMEPSPYQEIVAKRGGGAHHLAFLVDDLERAERQMERLGYGVILSGHGLGRDGDGGGSYFDTVETMGTVIEFAQLPREMPPMEGTYPPAGSPPERGIPGLGGAVHVAIAVRDAEKAARHYQEELGVGPWQV
ncbi:MAG: VOC family protein, partial [Deltaproteobacteria bacterium]|nr:VOC family protein [Deltaproteobacteria bacterium]